MKTRLGIILLLFHLYTSYSQSQQQEYSVLFYNVENLFDISNDSIKNDEEFTPGGERRWTHNRLERKLLNTSKALLSASGWNEPVLIGLCEVENRYVLNRLIKETPLRSYPFQIVHKDSPDARGIDVALLYNKDSFYPLYYEFYSIKREDGSELSSREILYASGIVNDADTLHVFVNHWPSRYSGIMETRELRMLAAKTLKKKIRELNTNKPNAKIIIMGDFNDQPEDESLKEHLGAANPLDNSKKSGLYNLSYNWLKTGMGTLKYRSQWFVFDQFIVSSSLLDENDGVHTKKEWAMVSKDRFFFEKDLTHGGEKLNRTYTGYQYNGGFSDHLPISLQIRIN